MTKIQTHPLLIKDGFFIVYLQVFRVEIIYFYGN
jgi:hypothetical protein